MVEGINPRLLEVVKAVDSYCQDNGVQYDIACDESDIQGIKLFQKNRRFVNGLMTHLESYLEENKVHLETQTVRGGTIFAFSLEAISENKIAQIIKDIGEEVERLSLRDRVNDAIERAKPTVETAPLAARAATAALSADKFADTAKSIVGGDSDDDSDSDEGAEDIASNSANSPSFGGSGVNTGNTLNFESRISRSMGTRDRRKPDLFKKSLRSALVRLENMQGMATPTQASPEELFKKFAKALQVLGQQMGIGPLQDRLKEQGIKWKKSDDGMSVILFILNAATNAPQPVARISAETLENPSDFEKALKDILDFSKGEAPGAFQQKQDELQAQQSAIRDISRSVSPENQSEVAQQMLANQGAQQELEQEVPQEGPLDMDAAQQAASLK